MNAQTKHPAFICLSTSLVMSGTDLIELAGAITEVGNANDHKLDRAEKALRNAADAIAEYRDRDTVTAPTPDPVIEWARPSCDRKETGLRFGSGLKLASPPSITGGDDGEAA